MTKLKVVVLLAVVALLLFPVMAFAQEMPPDAPCRFFGTVQLDGKDVPPDTTIQAIIGGEVVAQTETWLGTQGAFAGRSYYGLSISEPEGADYEGVTVSFTIDGNAADQTGTWESRESIREDLSAGEATVPVGGIKSVVIEELAAGENPRATLSSDGVLTLYLPPGPEGPKGNTGSQGPAGEPGDDAAGGIALPVIALVIAIIALGIAAMGMRRRV